MAVHIHRIATTPRESARNEETVVEVERSATKGLFLGSCGESEVTTVSRTA